MLICVAVIIVVVTPLPLQSRSRDVYGRSSDSGDHRSVLLCVSDAAQWRVLVTPNTHRNTNITTTTTNNNTNSNCNNDSSGSSNDSDSKDGVYHVSSTHSAHSAIDPAATENTTADGAVCYTIGALAENSILHARIPFRTLSEGGTENGTTVSMVVEVSGLLLRGGCRMPIQVCTEVVLNLSHYVTMTMTAYPLAELSISNSPDKLLLQCHLANSSDTAVELTGYGVHTSENGPAGIEKCLFRTYCASFLHHTQR